MTLNPLTAANLDETDRTTLAWLRRQPWQKSGGQYHLLSIAVEHPKDGTEPPHVKGNEGIGDGEIIGLIYKLEQAGVISKQEPYPLKGTSAPHDWSLSMQLDDLNNIGIHPKREVQSRPSVERGGRHGR